MLNGLASDARYAWRSLRRQRSANATAALVLLLGVALASSVFAIADPFVLRSLPYHQPDALVVLRIDPANLTRRHSGSRVQRLAGA